MPRERQFSEPVVAQQLADCFATHGYAGTSMALLQEATGLGKQSLYNTFGDKAAMYGQAVDCAVARFTQIVPAMQACKQGREALQLFFQHLARCCLSADPAEQRCIVTSGLLEDLPDSTLHHQLGQKWQTTHELLRSHIERGQRDGSVASPLPSAQLADQLMLAVSGLRVMAQVSGALERIHQSISTVLTVLDRH